MDLKKPASKTQQSENELVKIMRGVADPMKWQRKSVRLKRTLQRYPLLQNQRQRQRSEIQILRGKCGSRDPSVQVRRASVGNTRDK
jgi:hypothetical protein